MTGLGDARASPALRIENLSKSFGGARALTNVALDVARGEVHGLLGQNGSGKSTFVKVLAGFHTPDPGAAMQMFGRPVALPLRPGSFRDLGLAFVHQHLGLVPSLTVLENLRVASLTGRNRVIDWRAERRAATDALGRFGIEMDLAARVADLSQVDRALIAILRAFEDMRAHEARHASPGLLLLDEPTPFLPKEGVRKLFNLVRRIVSHGDSVIFISHDIGEILEITDRATVLRDGEVVGRIDTRRATHDDVVDMIVGRRVQRFRAERASHVGRNIRARLADVSDPLLRPTSLDVHEGEIVGLTGLIGSGAERIPYLAFGAKPATGGTLSLDGRSFDLARLTPKAAIAAGIALLPADRQGASGVGALPVADNLMVLSLGDFVRRLVLDRGRLRRRSREVCAAFEVRPNDPGAKLASLSGGNAQKVLLAKWLTRNPKLLMLDEPTQGVDVGTRQLLLKVVKDAARAGAGVICASSDFEQLAALCDRVLIFAGGAIVDELVGEDITKDHIAERCYRSVRLQFH